MMDAILCPTWQYRYFSFNARWAPGEEMGSMRNGQGDHYFAHFNTAGCWLKGFDHEAAVSPAIVVSRILEGMPTEFARCVTEPAFIVAETTFCIWRRYADATWQRSPVAFPPEKDDPDGSARLLHGSTGGLRHTANGHKVITSAEISAAGVEAIYGHQALDPGIVTELNPELPWAELAADIDEIGYPER